MASFEIILGATLRESSTSSTPRESFDGDVLDVIVDGERVSTATEPEHAACLLRDLIAASLAVLEGRTPKALVPLCDAPWELCFAAARSGLSMSLYRTGPVPEVRLLDRPISSVELVDQARNALATMTPHVEGTFVAELEAMLTRLAAAAASPTSRTPDGPDTLVRWRSRESEATDITLSFETIIGSAGVDPGEAVRADLHALLFRGRLMFDVRGKRGELAAGFVFLQIERLVSLCAPLLDAYFGRRALHLRVAAGDSMLGLRLGTDGRLALSLARAGAPTFTAPALEPRDFVTPVVDAALALAQGAIRCDRARARNLRLRALRTEARAIKRRLSDATRVQAKLNADPETYRASAVPAAPSALTSSAPAMNLSASARLRYVARWRNEIEGIDLRGTLLCGDRLVVPGARETLALDRRTGKALWTRPLPRAATTLAGGDILRLTSRGDVELRDVRDGEVLWTTRIAPRVGAPALAFSVAAPGLPRLVVLAEGERRLVALDLRTGEPRWRYGARQGGAFRIRRVGRLLIVVSGDATVTAIDAASGEVVWRHVGSAPFVLTPTVHRETIVASAGVPGRGAAHVVAIDAFTGAQRWSKAHGTPAASVPVGAGDTAALVLARREGMQLVGHDLATGEERYAVPMGAHNVPGGVVALSAFDDLMVANLPNGRVVAADAVTGTLRWSRVLAAPLADDTPRRLDVQLRAGALFVPQSTLAMLRPQDGSVLANVDACDLVPDLLRIDEECALYVAEESGHLACFELGARLGVLRSVN